MPVSSLNQILARLRSLALSHRQVNYFFFGDPHEFDANGDITYPACFCELQTSSVDRVNKLQRFNFRLYFLDLVGVSERTEQNETEVLSDMSQVADDLYSMLLNPVYQEDWIIDDSTNKAFVTEVLGDMDAGVIMDVGINLDFLADSCQVPADDVEFETSIDMPRTKIYKYTGTNAETNTISIPAMSGKHILGLWRSMAYKRAVAVAPTDSEKIQVGTTDLGSGQGVLGDGNFILETGDALIENEMLDILYYGT